MMAEGGGICDCCCGVYTSYCCNGSTGYRVPVKLFLVLHNIIRVVIHSQMYTHI